MNMKIFGILAVIMIIMGFGLQSVGAASSTPSLSNITNTTQQAIDNASDTLNHTAQDVQKSVGPIQSILNSINSVINSITSITQQIRQIFSAFGGGQ